MHDTAWERLFHTDLENWHEMCQSLLVSEFSRQMQCNSPRGRWCLDPLAAAQLCGHRKHSATLSFLNQCVFLDSPWDFWIFLFWYVFARPFLLFPQRHSVAHFNDSASTFHHRKPFWACAVPRLWPAHLVTWWSGLWPGMVGEQLRWGPCCHLVALWEAPKRVGTLGAAQPDGPHLCVRNSPGGVWTHSLQTDCCWHSAL